MSPVRGWKAVEASLAGGFCLVLVAGLLAGSGCASGGGQGIPVDAEIRNLAGDAQVAYGRGDAVRAAGLYERALTRARLLDETNECARNAYNLALCRIAEGRFDEALGLLAQARLVLPPRGADTARIWLAEAEAAQRQGRIEDVRGLVQRALESGIDKAGRAQAHLVLAGLACGNGDWKATRDELSLARRDLRAIDAPELKAREEGIAARLAQSDGDAAGAAAALERQSGWFKRAGRFKDMAESLLAAAEAYRKADLTRQAYPCLMRAAASLKGQGRVQPATLAGGSALAIAQGLNEPEWAAAAAALVAEMKVP